MELDYIREFVVLAETLHYAEAADRLYISPACLTRHIQAIEKELGQPLLLRSPRRVELSEFGKEFLPFAKKLAYYQQEYQSKLLNRQRRDRKLIVGSLGPLAPYRIGPIITAFQEQNPDILLECIRIRPGSEQSAIADNRCDFLFSSVDDWNRKEFEVLPCEEDSLSVLLPANHPLAAHDSIALSDLIRMRICIPDGLAKRNSIFIQHSRKEQLLPDYAVIDDIADALDNVLIKGYPVIMPTKVLLPYSKSDYVAVRPWTPELTSTMALVHRKAPPLTPLERFFLDFLTARLQTPSRPHA